MMSRVRGLCMPMRMAVMMMVLFLGPNAITATGGINLNADSQVLEKTLREHFSVNRHHLNQKNKEEARNYIINQFKDYGLDLFEDKFSTAQPGVTGDNIIGVMKGEHYGKMTDNIYIVGAHYDTMRNTSGVDDNGSGVSVMLETSRQMTRCKPWQHTVIFVSFDFEEWELQGQPDVACNGSTITCGSYHFLNTWMVQHLHTYYGNQAELSLINATIVLDTVLNYNATNGSQQLGDKEIQHIFPKVYPVMYRDLASRGMRGDFLTVISRRENEEESYFADDFISKHRAMTDKFFVESLYLPLLSDIQSKLPVNRSTAHALHHRLYVELERSDHAVFWGHNLPAIFLNGMAQYRGSMKNCYHEPCDNLNQINEDKIQFITKTTNVIIQTIGQLAKTTGSCPQVSGGPTLMFTSLLLVMSTSMMKLVSII